MQPGLLRPQAIGCFLAIASLDYMDPSRPAAFLLQIHLFARARRGG